MWKLELDEEYYRIYDSKKMIAGYFDPDYGNINPKNATEIIEQMQKNHDKIHGGFIMVPLVKFNLFDSDLNIDLSMLDSQLKRVVYHTNQWKDFLSTIKNKVHNIRISHTDQDMLTITFPIKFSKPVILKESNILEEIEPILEKLQSCKLL